MRWVLQFWPMETKDVWLGVAGCLRGEVQVPSSKSMAQRILMAARVARGTTRVLGAGSGADVRAALSIGEAFSEGDDPCSTEGAAIIRGRPPSGAPALKQVWSVGESGTLARFATALAALGLPPGSETDVVPSGSLARRSSAPLMRALDQAGVERHEQGPPGGWPVRVLARVCPEELILQDPQSSQEVSALLLALAARPGMIGRLVVHGPIPSLPYVRLTVQALELFGVTVHSNPSPQDTQTFHVEGALCAPPKPITIPPDASSAAVALAAGCLSGGTVTVSGLGLDCPQGDIRIMEYLGAFGCQTEEILQGGVRALRATGLPTRGVQLDLVREPDLAPVIVPLAAAAAQAGFGSRITGLGTLDGKESPRLQVLGAGLVDCGFQVQVGTESLTLLPGRTPGPAPCLDSFGDHRMAFAWTLLSWVVPGLRFRGSAHVDKSWPRFRGDLAQAGAEWEETGGSKS